MWFIIVFNKKTNINYIDSNKHLMSKEMILHVPYIISN